MAQAFLICSADIKDDDAQRAGHLTFLHGRCLRPMGFMKVNI
jgi:hypothetical protein